MSVYPNAFIVRLEDHWAPIGGIREHESRFDYVIKPNLKDGLDLHCFVSLIEF